MTYNELKEIISARIGGEYESVISDKIDEHVLTAMSQIIKSGDYARTDVPELLKEESISIPVAAVAELQLFGDSNDLTDSPDVIDIVSIVEDPDSEYNRQLRFFKKTKVEIANAISNEYLQPADDIVYYYNSGLYTRFYKSAIASGAQILVEYVVAPAGGWAGEMVGLYSLPFLHRVITQVVANMLPETLR